MMMKLLRSMITRTALSLRERDGAKRRGEGRNAEQLSIRALTRPLPAGTLSRWERAFAIVIVLALPAVVSAASQSGIADAAMRGDTTAVRLLIQQHSDVNLPQADGATALHWAVYRDDLTTVQLLLRAVANPKAVNREGASVLSLACINGNAAIIEALLKAGADANEHLANGETPIMLASRTGSVEAMKVLIDHGADVNAKEKLRGTTALMWAAAQSHPAAVKFLIEHGADFSARSNPVPKGRSAYLAPTAVER